MTRKRRRAAQHVLAGGGLMVSGVLLPALFPPTAMGVLLLLVLLRVCWLGDNIAHDLAGRDRLPSGYVNAARRRQRAIWTAFRIAPSSDPQHWRPALVATRMRAEEQAWYVFGSSVAAGLILAAGQPAGPFLPAATSLLIWAAMRNADRLAVTLACLDAARPLPRRELLARPAWVPGSRAGRGK